MLAAHGSQFGPVVVCHNDGAPLNLVVCRSRAEGDPCLIDWDFAAPAPHIWDLASMARSAAPLLRSQALQALGWHDNDDVGRRAAVVSPTTRGDR